MEISFAPAVDLTHFIDGFSLSNSNVTHDFQLIWVRAGNDVDVDQHQKSVKIVGSGCRIQASWHTYTITFNLGSTATEINEKQRPVQMVIDKTRSSWTTT